MHNILVLTITSTSYSTPTCFDVFTSSSGVLTYKLEVKISIKLIKIKMST